MSEHAAGHPVRAFGYTDVGKRSHNEDSFLVNLDIGLVMVADGVGGHHGGEVASDLTCKVLEREVAAGSTLEQGIKAANFEVFEAVEQELGRPGMASTVVALLFDGPAWILSWVGDSRAYLWDGQLSLLSRDHSVVEKLLQSGQISIEEARSHPKKNVIDQAIGLQDEDNLRIDSNYGELQPGQILMLCSDGLNDVIDSGRISEILATDASLEERCEVLVNAAVNAGGRDNTTVVVIEGTEALVVQADARDPDFVWQYDPASEKYTGLPEVKPKPKAAVKRVAPRVQEGTVLMKAPVLPGDPLDEAIKQEREDRNRRRYLWLAAAVVATLLAGGLMLIES
jgi:serine/threonine protein phosphatase PrpC